MFNDRSALERYVSRRSVAHAFPLGSNNKRSLSGIQVKRKWKVACCKHTASWEWFSEKETKQKCFVTHDIFEQMPEAVDSGIRDNTSARNNGITNCTTLIISDLNTDAACWLDVSCYISQFTWSCIIVWPEGSKREQLILQLENESHYHTASLRDSMFAWRAFYLNLIRWKVSLKGSSECVSVSEE